MARPFVLWFTGLSGAGKTTIATNVAERLAARGVEVVALDADVLRQSISQDLGYDDESRKEQARRISALAGAHVADGHSCIVAAITPFEESRLHARDTLGDNTYVEVFVDTPLSVAETRDPKGLYKKARAGEISNFTGISSVFERPNHSNVVIDTTAIDIETATNLVLAYLSAHDFIGES